jgi:GT2 family glycosyltransferase
MSTAQPHNLPPASVIICSRNRPQLLLESVESVLQGEAVPAELIIMDQSDNENMPLASMISKRGCQVRYVRTKTIGECPAKNEAIRLARHDILVFTDDDVFVSPDWFGSTVCALLSAGPDTVVTGRVLPAVATSGDGFVPSTKVDKEPAIYQGRIYADVLYPLNMAFYRCMIDQVGDFDIRLGAGSPFRGAEDNDFGFRVLEAGCRIVYAPDSIVYHRAWRTAKDYLPLQWSYGYGQGAYYAKHLSLRDRYMLGRMQHSVRRHLRLFLRLFWHERREAYAHAVYAFGILYGATKWLITQ